MKPAGTAARLVAGLLLSFAGALPGQDLSGGFNGYAKNLVIVSKSLFTGDAYLLNISRLRTSGSLSAGNFLHGELWLDHELLAGNFLKTTEFRLSPALARPSFADLDWTVSENDDHQLRQRLFRAFATVYLKQTSLTVGRQRIAWGTGFVWNPTDLFNPFNPAAIELDEKAGVDAAYLSLPLGSLSRFESAYAPGRGRLNASAAVRLSGHAGEYDFALMAGDFQNDKVVGGEFAGYLGGAGLRGELAYTRRDGDDDFLRAVLNADYNFPNDLYMFVEFHFNGQGSWQKENYDFEDLLAGRAFNLAQLYLAASLNKRLSPLLSTSLYAIANLNDRSALVGPAVTYSLATNLELALSAYLFPGAADSEYGRLSTTYFAFLQFYY